MSSIISQATDKSGIVAMDTNRRLKRGPPIERSDSIDFGILNERIAFLVFRSMKWDVRALSAAASVSRKLRAIVKRLLWRERCAHTAPLMTGALEKSAPDGGRIGGGWNTMAKLMVFCSGCEPTRNFKPKPSRLTPGHLVKSSRFSKTAGKSFLVKECRSDSLFVSDPCEHSMGGGGGGGEEDDLGVYRGVFKGFHKSRTRECLIRQRVKLERTVRCPYCGAPEWSMTEARLVPKSAARRLGSDHGALEYFVCVNGHMHGACWLVRLSSSDENDEDPKTDGPDESDFDDGVRSNESMESTVEELAEDGPAAAN